MTTMDEFMGSFQKPPLNKRKRIRMLATELAQGVYENLWTDYLALNPTYGPDNDKIREYFETRWPDEGFEHSLDLLRHNGYVRVNGGYRLSAEAFGLVDETEPFDVFISYKRSENSMFALLVNNTCKLDGLAPFFDMELNPTEEVACSFGESDQEV